MKFEQEVNLHKTFGSRLKYVCQIQQLTNKAAAELIGISVSHLGLLRRDKKYPSIPKLMNICKKLRVSSDYLLFGVDIPYFEPNDTLMTKIFSHINNPDSSDFEKSQLFSILSLTLFYKNRMSENKMNHRNESTEKIVEEISAIINNPTLDSVQRQTLLTILTLIKEYGEGNY